MWVYFLTSPQLGVFSALPWRPLGSLVVGYRAGEPAGGPLQGACSPPYVLGVLQRCDTGQTKGAMRCVAEWISTSGMVATKVALGTKGEMRAGNVGN